jgi:hypothetical protein
MKGIPALVRIFLRERICDDYDALESIASFRGITTTCASATS